MQKEIFFLIFSLIPVPGYLWPGKSASCCGGAMSLRGESATEKQFIRFIPFTVWYFD